MASRKLIVDPSAFLNVLKRLRANDDTVAFHTTGGLRMVIRSNNEPESLEKDIVSFDVSIVTESERPSVLAAIKNEFELEDDETGCTTVDEFEFGEGDSESLNSVIELVNAMDAWTVCPCNEYLIKDSEKMCYFCEMTRRQDDLTEQVFCPICHENGYTRWMVTTGCCKQKMHKKCKEACIVSENLRNLTTRCPLCRETW